MEVLCAVCRPSCLGVWESPTGDGGRGTVVGSQEWESQKCSDFGVTNVPTHLCTQRKVPDLHQLLLHSMQLAQALGGLARLPRLYRRTTTPHPVYLLICTYQGYLSPLLCLHSSCGRLVKSRLWPGTARTCSAAAYLLLT